MLGEALEALIYAALTGSKRRRGWVLFSYVISLESHFARLVVSVRRFRT
jgi:hypothetical protein